MSQTSARLDLDFRINEYIIDQEVQELAAILPSLCHSLNFTGTVNLDSLQAIAPAHKFRLHKVVLRFVVPLREKGAQ